ncbi:hypothetical protein B484DRAFT_299202, partial [Ochromonadaceae sp. CCMP2298]
YTGQMRGGKLHGFGRTSWATGKIESYDGQWRDNERQGRAILKWRNGRSYEGCWKDDRKHG